MSGLLGVVRGDFEIAERVCDFWGRAGLVYGSGVGDWVALARLRGAIEGVGIAHTFFAGCLVNRRHVFHFRVYRVQRRSVV